jgi:hypothetical protein
MYVHLTEASGHTTVTFGQRMRTLTDEADYGVGWDYYLDRMLAAHDGRPLPRWDDYYPSMLDHYETLCRELSADLKTEHAAAHRDGTLG